MANGHKENAGALGKEAALTVVSHPLLETDAYPLLDLPAEVGAPSTQLWDELVEEARTLDALVGKLKQTGRGVEREKLEQALLGSLTHLRVHAAVLEESVDEALLKTDELEHA